MKSNVIVKNALICGEKMSDILNNSAFYHFGILPQVCTYSIIEDEYSKMYIPREKCDCGNSDWVEGTLDILKPINGYSFPKKDIHRCKKCNSVRLSDHIGVKDER